MPGQVARPGGETPRRSKSAASTGSRPVEIHRAQIVNVNTADFTVDVRYESYPYSSFLDLPYMTPYVHQNQGEGINFAPEVGSTCWVCTPSEEGKDAFVLGWTLVAENGSYRGGRQQVNPGDQHFSTRDGNFLFLRRGGIVQIGATSVCQRVYIPIRNRIRDMAENYELSTPAGDLTWEIQREEDQADGHRPATFTLACKEYSDDPNDDPIATLKMGSHGDGNDTILTLQTLDKGGGSVKTKLEISKSGKVTWKIEDDIEITVKGKLDAKIQKNVSLEALLDVLIKSNVSIKIMAPGISLISGAGSLILGASGIFKGGSISLGEAQAPVVIDTGELGAWFQAVTALLNGGGQAFKGILPPLTHYKSKDVKA